MRAPVSDVFGKKGRGWLSQAVLPPAPRGGVDTYCGSIDSNEPGDSQPTATDREVAESDPRAKWLATIPGIGVYSAMPVLSEIGEIQDFRRRSRCSATRDWVMVEAAHTAARHSPAAKRYFERMKQRKHAHVACVALARKLLAAVCALLRNGVCFDESIFAAV